MIDCRRVLKYTYVLGYFLQDASAEKQLFEHHQEMLEKNTEKLSEYTEYPLDKIDRSQVINLTRVTERFMASLMSSMMDGFVTVTSEENENNDDDNQQQHEQQQPGKELLLTQSNLKPLASSSNNNTTGSSRK